MLVPQRGVLRLVMNPDYMSWGEGDVVLQVSTYACPDHVAVLVLVSPQPPGGAVWADLGAVRDGFSCW